MKSLHVNLTKGWRGGERQTLLLVEGLREAGDVPELLARRGEPLAARAAASGIPVHHGLGTLFRARRRGFSVVHAHDARSLQWAALARVLGDPPLVATRRVDNQPGDGWYSRFKYRRADWITAVSEHVRAVMVDWGADPRKLSVVTDAVPPTPEPDRARVTAVRAKLAGKRVIGFVGALVNKHKDPLTLVRSFDRLRHREHDVALLIVGEGPDRRTLEAYIEQHNVPDVHLIGFVEDPETFYACMDVFVLPSRMEGLGSAALDAFAAGIPVIAGRAGALPEIVRHKETGLLFEPGDDAELAECILRLLQHPDECQSLARAAIMLLHQCHTTHIMTAAYRALYAQLAE